MTFPNSLTVPSPPANIRSFSKTVTLDQTFLFVSGPSVSHSEQAAQKGQGTCLCVSLCTRSVMSSSFATPQTEEPARLLCSWDFPGKNTGVSCHFLLQEIFSTQGSKPHLLHLFHCGQVLYH